MVRGVVEKKEKWSIWSDESFISQRQLEYDVFWQLKSGEKRCDLRTTPQAPFAPVAVAVRAVV